MLDKVITNFSVRLATVIQRPLFGLKTRNWKCLRIRQTNHRTKLLSNYNMLL